jgi:hypothetical protein
LAQIEFYDIEFKHQGSSWYSFLIEVNNKINCPYYLGSGKKLKTGNKNAYIRLYDSKIAMLINLYGSLEEYKEEVSTPSSYSKHLPRVQPAPMKGVGVRGGTLSGIVNRIRQGSPEERSQGQDKKLRNLVKQIEQLQLATPKNTHKPKPISF